MIKNKGLGLAPSPFFVFIKKKSTQSAVDYSDVFLT